MYKNYSTGNNLEAKRTKGYFNDLPCNLPVAKGTNTGFICEKIVGKGKPVLVQYFTLL